MISEAMLEDMQAAAAGRPFRERSWKERPWKAGERLVIRIREDGTATIREHAATVKQWGEGIFAVVLDDPEVKVLDGDVIDMRPVQ